MKIIHILSAAIWLGAGGAGLFLLTAVLNAGNLKAVLSSVHYIDLLIIVPANVITLVSGIVFSKFTDWGFFKHRWIALKYVINIIPIIFGGAIFAPSIINMLSITEKLGEAAVADPSFIASKHVFVGAFVVQLLLLATAVCLSVLKPKFRKR